MEAATDLFLGHDLGTGGDKAALVDLDGNLLASAFVPYELSHPAPKHAEQDPDDYWRAVCETTRAVLADAGVRADRVAARKTRNERSVGMTLSLAFLAPDPVEAAIHCSLARG